MKTEAEFEKLRDTKLSVKASEAEDLLNVLSALKGTLSLTDKSGINAANKGIALVRSWLSQLPDTRGIRCSVGGCNGCVEDYD